MESVKRVLLNFSFSSINTSVNLESVSIFPWKILFFQNFNNCSLIDACYELRSNERGVAQLGSAGALGALGRRFESCRPDHLKTKSY